MRLTRWVWENVNHRNKIKKQNFNRSQKLDFLTLARNSTRAASRSWDAALFRSLALCSPIGYLLYRFHATHDEFLKR